MTERYGRGGKCLIMFYVYHIFQIACTIGVGRIWVTALFGLLQSQSGCNYHLIYWVEQLITAWLGYDWDCPPVILFKWQRVQKGILYKGFQHICFLNEGSGCHLQKEWWGNNCSSLYLIVEQYSQDLAENKWSSKSTEQVQRVDGAYMANNSPDPKVSTP